MVSQLMTLYLTPVVYTYMASLLDWWRGRGIRTTIETEPGYGFTD